MKQFATTGARERAAFGKSLRAAVPRSDHGVFEPSAGRRPLERLAAVADSRLHALLPIRNARMYESAFAFYRGSSVIMAADLAGTPDTGLEVQACGDAHCANFGGFATPERNLIFDLNDFDETLPGPWEWDIKRLVTSFVLAARANDHSEQQVTVAATAAAQAYRERMRELAALPALDVWYGRLAAIDILDRAKKHRSDIENRHAGRDVATASTQAAVGKFTEIVAGERRFIEDPPTLFHSEVTGAPGFDIPAILQDYEASLPDDVLRLYRRYRLTDVAIKVVGVGSVGSRCGIALLVADDHDVLLLQIKEATASVLAPFRRPSEFVNQGERVVRGQRLMQSASDLFLGWASSGDYDYYMRQFKDMKVSADLAGASAGDLRDYARYCAWALAAAHARSGDAAAIGGYLGSGDTIDRALVRFAFEYARQSEADYEAFCAAVEAGRVAVAAAAH